MSNKHDGEQRDDDQQHLDQEQALADLDQSIADREQAVVDGDQAAIARDDADLENKRAAVDTSDFARAVNVTRRQFAAPVRPSSRQCPGLGGEGEEVQAGVGGELHHLEGTWTASPRLAVRWGG